MNGADILIDSLHAFGVDTIFGMPGDGINGIMEAIRTRQDRIRFIQVRHEESAAFAATAHAKFTGKLGCCLATTGPGGIHLLNGLYDAKLDRAPVIAITGSPYHDLSDTFTQQDIDHSKVFMDVAEYTTRVMGAGHMANAVSLACRHALGYRGVAHLSVPVDVQEDRCRTIMRRTATSRVTPRWCPPTANASRPMPRSPAPPRCSTRAAGSPSLPARAR